MDRRSYSPPIRRCWRRSPARRSSSSASTAATSTTGRTCRWWVTGAAFCPHPMRICGTSSPPVRLGPSTSRHVERVLVQVTSVGHAGFRIETNAGAILCDPWVNPAYFASWFPFPDNSELDWNALGDCDYLYVSHLHADHFDPKNLREHVDKDAVVLLPDFPVPDLQRELEKVGFHRFFETTDSVKHTITGPKGDLDVMIIALRAPADGPIGDSGLVIDDG